MTLLLKEKTKVTGFKEKADTHTYIQRVICESVSGWWSGVGLVLLEVVRASLALFIHLCTLGTYLPCEFNSI